MLVGHLAVGLAARRIDRTISIGTGVLATMLADLLWPVFTAAGLERVNFRQAMGAGNYFDAVDIAWSHSLLADAVWAGIAAGLYLLVRRSRRGAWVVFGAVLSHWLLDVVSHRPDMLLAPGVHAAFGLGLWTSIPATIVLEGGAWRSPWSRTRGRSPRGRAPARSSSGAERPSSR